MKKSFSLVCCLVFVLVFSFSSFGASKSRDVTSPAFSEISGSKISESFGQAGLKKLKLNASFLSAAEARCASASTKRGWLACIAAAVNFLGAVRDGLEACNGSTTNNVSQDCIAAVDTLVASIDRLGEDCAFLAEDGPVAELLERGFPNKDLIEFGESKLNFKSFEKLKAEILIYSEV